MPSISGISPARPQTMQAYGAMVSRAANPSRLAASCSRFRLSMLNLPGHIDMHVRLVLRPAHAIPLPCYPARAASFRLLRARPKRRGDSCRWCQRRLCSSEGAPMPTRSNRSRAGCSRQARPMPSRGPSEISQVGTKLGDAPEFAARKAKAAQRPQVQLRLRIRWRALRDSNSRPTDS